MSNKINIAVAVTRYVGLGIATLLAQHHEVVMVDFILDKIVLIVKNYQFKIAKLKNI